MSKITQTMAPDSTAERDLPDPPFGAPHVFVLVAVGGPDPSALHRMAQDETVVGRDDGADFRIDDEAISKAHLRIRVEGGVCTIMDLDSRNGTELNSRPLRPRVAQRLRHLDEVRIGDTRLLILGGRFRE